MPSITKHTPTPLIDAAMLSTQLARLLDRPAKMYGNFPACREKCCTAIRQRPYTCRTCGYQGPGFVWGSDCKSVQPCKPGKCDECAHGHRECPVCFGGIASVDYHDHYDNPWKLVRDLRAVLRRGGLL